MGLRIVCPYCPREFKNKHGLEVHIGMAHKDRLPPQPSPVILPLKCVECGEMVTKRGWEINSLVMFTVDGKRLPFHKGCFHRTYNPMHNPVHRVTLSKSNKEWWTNLSEEEKNKYNKGLRNYWANVSEEERSRVETKHSKSQRRRWAKLSDEEKQLQLRHLHLRPNTSEKHIDKIVSPLGFEMNVDERRMIGGRFPDFIHSDLPLIIESDGGGGHSPLPPWMPDTWEECFALDDQRDADYRGVGYKILRIFPEDLAEGDDFIREKVGLWMLED